MNEEEYLALLALRDNEGGDDRSGGVTRPRVADACVEVTTPMGIKATLVLLLLLLWPLLLVVADFFFRSEVEASHRWRRVMERGEEAPPPRGEEDEDEDEPWDRCCFGFKDRLVVFEKDCAF